MHGISSLGKLRRQSGVRLARIGGVALQRLVDYRDETGQTMPEYALVLAVITPAIVVALALLSESFQERLETVTAFLT